MDTYRTLLVNFDSSLQAVSGYFLKRPGYMTVLADTLAEASRHLSGSAFDLIILNLHANGTEDKVFVSTLCESYPNSTLIVLGEQKSFDLVLQLLRQKVFDYILKTDGSDAVLKRLLTVLEEVSRKKRRQNYLVQLEQLLAQLKSELNIPGSSSETCVMGNEEGRYLKQGPFVVDLNTRQVIYKEKTVVLTQGTLNYFLVLLRHAPSPVQPRALVFEAQGYDMLNSEALGIAKWHIHQLRSSFNGAFGEDPIETIRGTGYRMKVNMTTENGE